MEVILLERVEKLGQMGDVVNVKPGFARNFLLPQRKALRATKANVADFETKRSQLEAVNLEKRDEAAGVSDKLDGLSVVIVRQASDSDQLYGSVTTRDIAREVTAAGFTVDKVQIQLARPIKTVGLHEVQVRLHPEVTSIVTANVARSEEEAEAQARGERPGLMDDDDEENPVEAAEAMFEEGAANLPSDDDEEASPESSDDEAEEDTPAAADGDEEQPGG